MSVAATATMILMLLLLAGWHYYQGQTSEEDTARWTQRIADNKKQVDELNTVACGSDRPVSNTFASALWALDTLFASAQAGVDGINIHTFPGAGYELFRVSRPNGRWQAAVGVGYQYVCTLIALGAALRFVAPPRLVDRPGETPGLVARLASAAGSAVARRPWRAIGGAAIAVLAALWGSTRVTINSYSVLATMMRRSSRPIRSS